MTFEERCERFARKTKGEHNRFKFVCRVAFLNKKIEEYERGVREFDKVKVTFERPKEHKSCKQLKLD